MLDTVIKLAKKCKMSNVDIFKNSNKIFMFAEDTIDDEQLYILNNLLEDIGYYFDPINIKMATLREIEEI